MSSSVRSLSFFHVIGGALFKHIKYISKQRYTIPNIFGNQNIKVHTAYIQMNGDDRFEKRDGKYFSQVQRYQHHTSAGINNTRIGVGSDDVTSDLVKAKWYPKTCNAHI